MSQTRVDKSGYTRRIKEALSRDFPREAITVYRYNSVSWRVRIIDDRFAGLSLIERDQLVRPLIRSLPEEIQRDITALLMLTPDEVGESLMNLEFEHPSRSRL
jgi:stress-induced morphogen